MDFEKIDIVMSTCIEDDDSIFSSSSSSSISDFELELFITTGRKRRIRIENYVEEIVDAYNEEEFRKHFRMSRKTADFCIDLIAKANVIATHLFGREKVTAKKAFLITVWYLANTETFRQVSDWFNITESCYNIINKITNYFVSLSPNYITWPKRDQQLKLEAEFKKRQGLNGIVGCIDGSHILINRPKDDQETYCNRKGTHSIILQAVVDSRRKFIDVSCGEPGSLHDARVLKKSSLYRRGVNSESELESRYILGDSAYPSLPWLVPPFKDNGNLTFEEKQFNLKHSSSRIVVENAFGLLKGRFRRIRHFENRNINFIVNCVVTACTLHNICLDMDNSDEIIDIIIDEI